MIAVSDAWKDIHQRFLLAEGHIEIKCEVSEMGAQETATANGTNEEFFSEVSKIADADKISTSDRYATNEHNWWVLDGSLSILPDSTPYNNAGYISGVSESGSVTLTLPEVHTVAIPGVMVVWDELHGECPSVFTVTAKNGDTVVAETTITDNTESVCAVDLELTNYDSVTVTAHNWCVPNRRVRIEQVTLGHILTLTKKDIISYTHEQRGDLLSGELPKYSIEFALNNIDGRWNPSNPTGIEKYLSERQRVTVKYGFKLDDGSIEWIKAGTFYLSEWNAPSNGLEARFVARDIFEYLMNADKKSATTGTLKALAETAIADSLPEEAEVVLDNALTAYSAEYAGDGTSAVILQKCANGARCVLRYDREGVLHVEPLNLTPSGYMIPLSLSYSHPEVKLTKPLRNVSVDYGADAPYELSVSSVGETQTVNNSFVTTEAQASALASWVRDTLNTRKSVSGDFRADPRLDLFDIVEVESKYGKITPVAITSIKYTFTGAFRGSYEGRVLEEV